MSLATTTTYLVETKYVVDDRRAAGGLRNIGAAADKAAFSTAGLKRHLMGIGTLLVGGSAFMAGKKALIGFNSDLEQTKLRMAGLLSLNTGGTVKGQLGTAKQLVGELTQYAKVSTATTSELAGFLGDTIQPLTSAGMKAKDLAGFTYKAFVAAKAFGDEATAALDVQQALGEGIHVRDRFGMKLLGTLKMTNDEFNALGKSQRLEMLTKALSHPAIAEMGQLQAKTFAGQWSTFKDNLQLALGKVGLPLMQKLTAEVKQWNDWIDKHPQKIQEFAEKFGKALVDGFNVVKSIGSFIAANRDVLMALAKAALVFKGVNMIGGALGKLAGIGGGGWFGAQGLMAHMPPLSAGLKASAAGLVTFSKEVGGVTRMMTGLAAAGGAFGMLAHEVATMVADQVDRQQERGLRAAERQAALQTYVNFANRKGYSAGLVSYARETGLLNKGGGVNQAELMGRFSGQDAGKKFNEAKTLLNIAELTDGHMKAAALTMKAIADQEVRERTANSYQQGVLMADMIEKFWKGMDKSSKRFLMGYVKTGESILETLQTLSILPHKKQNINVTIHKVEVPAKDPDRWIHDLNEFALRRVRAPTQARAALSGGF